MPCTKQNRAVIPLCCLLRSTWPTKRDNGKGKGKGRTQYYAHKHHPVSSHILHLYLKGHQSKREKGRHKNKSLYMYMTWEQKQQQLYCLQLHYNDFAGRTARCPRICPASPAKRSPDMGPSRVCLMPSLATQVSPHGVLDSER